MTSPLRGVDDEELTSFVMPGEAGVICHSSFALARILHVLDDVELHVPQAAVLLLHLAQVDVLDDVARLGVDEHRAARALEDLALHAVDQGLAAALAAGLLQRLVDDAHAVIATD